MDYDALMKLPRETLQALAKRERIKANGASKAIARQLADKYPDGVPSLEGEVRKRTAAKRGRNAAEGTTTLVRRTTRSLKVKQELLEVDKLPEEPADVRVSQWLGAGSQQTQGEAQPEGLAALHEGEEAGVPSGAPGDAERNQPVAEPEQARSVRSVPAAQSTREPSKSPEVSSPPPQRQRSPSPVAGPSRLIARSPTIPIQYGAGSSSAVVRRDPTPGPSRSQHRGEVPPPNAPLSRQPTEPVFTLGDWKKLMGKTTRYVNTMSAFTKKTDEMFLLHSSLTQRMEMFDEGMDELQGMRLGIENYVAQWKDDETLYNGKGVKRKGKAATPPPAQASPRREPDDLDDMYLNEDEVLGYPPQGDEEGPAGVQQPELLSDGFTPTPKVQPRVSGSQFQRGYEYDDEPETSPSGGVLGRRRRDEEDYEDESSPEKRRRVFY
ncbi:hypothetical protein BXZ70DRAFT_926002 [Cristinia sonorae]|uniref:Uncharacterized protein n=1 Tax=Cristinia sonorae TaxID=1940300 RepID=A0A8K0XS92_9AGAR|nr:hypothetical protein BXZ70DRAFT_926002 [Cristinia sonorae]